MFVCGLLGPGWLHAEGSTFKPVNTKSSPRLTHINQF